MSISVSILETGTIRIRPSHRTHPVRHQSGSPAPLARVDRPTLDRAPAVNTYLVDHPEGYVLFDAGESPHSTEKGYFPWWQPFFHVAVDIRVGPDEGIGARLRQRGLDPARDLKAVVLSPLQHDHGDGLPDLVGAPVHVTREHWKAFGKPFPATMEGAVPKRWPKGFTPHFLEPTGGPVGPWDRSYPLASDGRILAVDTPGHVPGHVCLIVFGDQATYLLGGDSTYDQDLLDAERLADSETFRPSPGTA
ncbi:MBL fold metallo-hydrolase [Streptomyces sp. NPDC001617]